MNLRLPCVASLLLIAGCGSSGSGDTAPVTTDGSVQGDVSVQPDGSPVDGAPPDVQPKDQGTEAKPPPDAGPDAPPLEAGPDAAPDVKPPVSFATVVMGGDIAEDGRTQHARKNADMIKKHDPPVEAVVLVGDNARYDPLKLMTLHAYYTKYYQAPNEADWGQFDPIAFPQLGNHEYASLNSQGYFDYYKPRTEVIKAKPGYSGFVDEKSKGYYSFDLNGWHFVSLNSNCSSVSGGCAAGSAQETWLKDDLAAHPNQPIIAAWHAPRWACGGDHPSDDAVQPFWADLYDARADFVFVGHDHYYQRWKPLDKATPEAALDSANGLTEVVVGSYGVSPYDVCNTVDPRVGEQIGGDSGAGVFFLKLGSDGSYSFEYLLESDGSLFDSGAGVSHHPS